MKNYLEEMIQTVEKNIKDIQKEPSVKAKLVDTITKAKDILKDPKFMQQKGVRSLVDKDARVGRKSKTKKFYGYKTEITMLTEERIVLTTEVDNGVYVDGTRIDKHLQKIKDMGIEIKEFYADKAYFRSKILDLLEQEKITPYIPVSASAYKINEEKYSYNKDSDTWMCNIGNETEKKKYFSRKDGRKGYRYYFKKEVCKNCPIKNECIGKKTARKILTVALSTPKLYQYSQKQKSKEFLEKFKNRASIENKNAELKRFHGMAKARGFGLKSISTQIKLTVLAVNLKRIARLFSNISYYLLYIFKYLLFKNKIFKF